MRPEARPIEFRNGRAHFYRKKKVDIYTFYGNLSTSHTFPLIEIASFVKSVKEHAKFRYLCNSFK